MQDEITRYGPTVLATLAVSVLVARHPGYLGLSKERARSSLYMFYAALVLFVALDVVTGRALTSMADIPRAAAIIFATVATLLIANLIYLFVRRRAPR